MRVRESNPVRSMAPHGSELVNTEWNHSRELLGPQREDEPMIEYLRAWLRLKTDTRAVTALEYALIGSLIAVAIIGALTTMGTNIKTTFNTIANNL